MNKRYRVVHVIWQDACSQHSWTALDSRLGIPIIKAVGIVVHEDEKVIELGMGITEAGPTEAGLGWLRGQIPKNCIRKIETIAWMQPPEDE